MINFRRISFGIAVIMALGLSGCGSNSSDDGGTTDSNNTQDSTLPTPETPETSPTSPTSLTKKWETNLDVPESAIYDNINKFIYVSNVNAYTTGDGWADNNGFISKLDKNGDIITKEFITGLKSPKGLVLNKEHLYVADVDTIVDINITNGVILNTFNAPSGVNRLNSLAYDTTTDILYASDSSLHKIYKMKTDGSFSEFYDKEASYDAHQNGIDINLKNIIMQGEQGYLKSINIDTKVTSTISSSIHNINIDGITKYYNLGYIISSATENSEIYFVSNDGTSTLLLITSSGAGDISFSSDLKLLLVPNINDKIIAYEIVN